MARRAAGEGSIYPVRRNGKVVGYAASLSLGYTPDGKRNRKKVEGKTRRDVAEKLATLREEFAEGVDLTKRSEATRVLLKRWPDDVYAETARPSSVDKYAWAFDKVEPFIGDIPAQKLTSHRAQHLITDLKGTGLGATSIGQVIDCLHHAFNHFVRPWKLIRHNPFDDVVTPRSQPKKAVFLTPEQAETLLEAIRAHWLEAAFRLMLSLGLRRGEVCGLLRDELDFENRRFTISGTVQYIKGQGLVRSDTAKSDAGNRILPMPATIVAALT